MTTESTRSTQRHGDDRFCPICDVDLGLHGTNTPAQDGSDCKIAERKADLLGAFHRTLGLTP